jgi:hypothetical protein
MVLTYYHVILRITNVRYLQERLVHLAILRIKTLVLNGISVVLTASVDHAPVMILFAVPVGNVLTESA